MKIVVALLLALGCSVNFFGYTYGEHKEIGDRAFLKFALALGDQEFAKVFLAFTEALRDDGGNYYFADLSVEGGNRVSYGVLNALSGDHQSTPLELEAQLRTKDSLIQRIVLLHERYIAMGYTAAPDAKLARMDFGYVLQAAVNLSHFYEYKHSFQQQFRPFEKSRIRECEDPSLAGAAFGKLGQTNAIDMYVTIHAAAIDLAERSARLLKAGNNGGEKVASNEKQARQLLHYALLYNAYADHFLEDAFSSGHLVVNRTVLASVTNNKALHDFYSENGTTVLNRNGEIWKAYGDGQLNNTHESWRGAHKLEDIAYTGRNQDLDRIVEAVRLSLQDVWNAFQRAGSDSNYVPVLQGIPDERDRQADFLMNAFAGLRLVPIPYNSNLPTLFPQGEVTDAMRQANQRLGDREFVRSRIGNSFVLGVNSRLVSANDLQGFEFRVNAGDIGRKYPHNAEGGKQGTSDYWLGYTASYSFGDVGVKENGASQLRHYWQLKGGIRSNLDRWITNKRFVGFYSYNEVGVQYLDNRAEVIFVPSLGLQLGSLFKINYYNMPGWLRLPAEYILPLKIRIGTVISQHEPPKPFSGIDVDFVF
ncbi:MAG TPA: hypothetical protein VKZ53_12330 [Candidatus Angelobacter sp.]|nr:hypothetical protein [Candidatus Angelobacter sp.]